MTTITTQRYIDLHFENTDGKVRVKNPGNNVMILTVGEAIRACELQHAIGEFLDQSFDLVEYLADWVQTRKDRIKQAYLSSRDGRIFFLVVTRSAELDETIEEDATNLEIAIARNPSYKLLHAMVHTVPNCDGSEEAFLNNVTALRFVKHAD